MATLKANEIMREGRVKRKHATESVDKKIFMYLKLRRRYLVGLSKLEQKKNSEMLHRHRER